MIDVGATVGNYLVKTKIGEGGMGMVWMAEHPLIGKKVAIKVIHPSYAKNAEAISRFFVEAQAVNKVGHPNIVDITDLGQTPEGESYFIMEYLQGTSLAGRVEERGLTLAETVHVVAQIADALAASHSHGILHRDLKPDNVFLVKRGQDDLFVKVLDFGLAKLTNESDKGGTHKTRTGSMMGTPYYMAPEQCAGKASIDARADVYALGVMLFELVSGRVPFPGEGYGEIIVKHMTEPPPSLLEAVPACPPWLDALVARCMVKDVAGRLSSMNELRDELMAHLGELPGGNLVGRSSSLAGSGSNPPWRTPSQLSDGRPVSTMNLAAGEATSVPPPSRRGLWLGIGGAAVVAGVVGVVVATRGGDKPQAAAQPPAPTPAPAPAPSPTPDPTPAPAGPVLVSIELTTVPPGAKVSADGTTVCGGTPCTWTVASGKVPVKITFELAGYEPRTREVVPDQSRALPTDLVKLAGAPVEPPPAKPKRERRPRPGTPDPGSEFKPLD